MGYSLKVRLVNKHLQVLSVIAADIGQAVFASTIVPFTFGLDKIELRIVLLGLITAMTFWVVSIYLAR